MTTLTTTATWFWRESSIWYYEWAIRSIDPSHPNVPYIVTRLMTLRQQQADDKARRAAGADDLHPHDALVMAGAVAAFAAYLLLTTTGVIA